MIRRGDADVMLSGGSHSMIHPFGVTGFNLLTALSTRNDEPHEGVAARSTATATASSSAKGPACSSSKSSSTPRSAARTIYAEVAGYGSTADAFRITDSHPEGRGAIACIDGGARGRRPAARATSTTSTPTAPAPQVNDRVETLAIKQVFGDARLQDAGLAAARA